MNLSKPLHIIILGSSLLAVMVLLVMILLQVTTDSQFHLAYYIIFPILTGGLSFALFSILIEKFINKKIRLIYRIIGSQKFSKNSDIKVNQDVLDKLTKDTAKWAITQKNQIESLKKQDEFRKEFLGNLAHELKTPVFSIQGYILTLLEGGLEDEKVNRNFLERALNGVERISNILGDLDDISRFEYDDYHLKITEFDVVRLVKETFYNVEQKALEKGIKVEFNKEYNPIMVKADRSKIGQVLLNLISNAISYGNENGNVNVKFHDIDRKTLLVEVDDDGLGIKEEHLPRLFERFYRVEKSRARNIGGSGLGLSIVKHIIEAHNQSINVRSTEGKGSTFSFTLEKI